MVFLQLIIAGDDGGILWANNVHNASHVVLELVERAIGRQGQWASIRSTTNRCTKSCLAWTNAVFTLEFIVLLHDCYVA